MKAWGIAVAAAVLGWAGAAGAGGFAPSYGTVETVPVPASVAPGATGLEVLRYQSPQIGRDIQTVVNGVPVATIEWRHEVTLRVQTATGVALTEADVASVQGRHATCRRGEVVVGPAYVEPSGTYVLKYACAWVQGT